MLIGADGGERQTAEDLADRIGTINYEILCGISARVPRGYHRDGEPRREPSRSPRCAADRRAGAGSSAARCATALLGRPTDRLRRRRRRASRGGWRARAGRASARRRTRSRSRRRSAPGAWSRATHAGRSTCCRSTATTIEDDLRRRDLTINAIAAAARAAAALVDPFGGRRGPRAAAGCGWSRRDAFAARPAARAAAGAARLRAELRRRAGRRSRPRARSAPGAGARVAPSGCSPSCGGRDRATARSTGLELMDALGVDRRRSCPSWRRCAGSSRAATTTSTSTTTRGRCWPRRSRSSATRRGCSARTATAVARAARRAARQRADARRRRCASARCCTTSPSRRRAA